MKASSEGEVGVAGEHNVVEFESTTESKGANILVKLAQVTHARLAALLTAYLHLT